MVSLFRKEVLSDKKQTVNDVLIKRTIGEKLYWIGNIMGLLLVVVASYLFRSH